MEIKMSLARRKVHCAFVTVVLSFALSACMRSSRLSLAHDRSAKGQQRVSLKFHFACWIMMRVHSSAVRRRGNINRICRARWIVSGLHEGRCRRRQWSFPSSFVYICIYYIRIIKMTRRLAGICCRRACTNIISILAFSHTTSDETKIPGFCSVHR